MIPNTRADLSERVQRRWPALFGQPSEMVRLTPKAEEDRLFVAAQIQADDFRHDPDPVIAQASAEERFAYARGLCRIVRHHERGDEVDDER